MACIGYYVTPPETLLSSEKDWLDYFEDIEQWAEQAQVLSILRGTRIRPVVDSKARDAYDDDHAYLMHTIRNTMSAEMKKAYIRFDDDAAILWERLKHMFMEIEFDFSSDYDDAGDMT